MKSSSFVWQTPSSFLEDLHVKVGIDKGNLLYRTHKMEALPVAWPTSQI